MRATVKRTEMVEVLSKVQKGIMRSTTLPIAECVLLDAKAGRLAMAATDLQTSICGILDAKIGKNGACAVKPQKLLVFIQSVKTDDIVLSVENGRLKVQAGAASVFMDAADSKEFPRLPVRLTGKPAVLRDFSDTLGKVQYAASKDDARPVLTGICIDGKALTACDGFRLATTKLYATGKTPDRSIIPYNAVKLIRSLMPGNVEMLFDNQYLQFEANGILMVVTPIDGNYPQYTQLIPKGRPTIRFDRDEIRQAIKIMKDGSIVRLLSKGSKLSVYTTDSDNNETRMTLPCKGRVKAGFNPKYLDEVLSKMPEGVVPGRLDTRSASLFKAEGVTHLLMPMTVPEFDEKKPELPPIQAS